VDVIIAGRCTDPALFAAVPMKRGFDHALTWMMSKIIECGAACLESNARLDPVLATLTNDHVLISTMEPARATVSSVTAHILYERDNPYIQLEPGGALDTTDVKIEQYDERTVKVTGAKFTEMPYTVKLEAARLIGYRAIALYGFIDPFLIRDIDSVVEHTRARIKKLFQDGYRLYFHVYGKNAVMENLDPMKDVTPHEIAFVLEVVAERLELAIDICEAANGILFGAPYKGKLATAGNTANLYSMDPYVPVHPEVFEWSMGHLMELDDPCECFPMRIEEVRG